MTTEPDDLTLPESPEDNLEEELRRELHAQVDRMFENAKTGLDIYCQLLGLAGRLVAQASPYIDLNIARELAGPKTKDAVTVSERARDDVRAAHYDVDGKTFESTAKAGLIGAHTIVGQLAAVTNDPYLTGLAHALGQVRFGQVHPWLSPVKTPVHPKQYASDVLGLKGIPFGVIEYLVASGLSLTKTEATAAVVERLGISEDTLRDWRKQQLKYCAAQFDLELRTMRLVGPEINRARENLPKKPVFRDYVAAYDRQFGLPAIDWVAKALENLGAHKGQR